MASVLLQVLEREVGSLRPIDRTWQPKGLLVDPYRRNLLKDIEQKYEGLALATDEFMQLDRADKYIKLLSRIRLNVRQATYAWRFNDLLFIQAVASVYTDYGSIIRMLANDRARGLLDLKVG